MYSKRGFTIIELLTTIAIIGILAAVILPRLQMAREEGINAKISAELNALSRRASVEESLVRNYNFVCGSNGDTQSPEIGAVITSIESLSPALVVCNSDNGEYAVSATLAGSTGSSTYACVDRSGEVTKGTTTLASATYTCP